MYVAPESKVLMVLANVAATSNGNFNPDAGEEDVWE